MENHVVNQNLKLGQLKTTNEIKKIEKLMMIFSANATLSLRFSHGILKRRERKIGSFRTSQVFKKEELNGLKNE